MHLSISRYVAALGAAFLVCALGGPASAAAPDVTCRACIVVEADGTVLWAREARAPLPNASTTKMVTAILVARRARFDETVLVSPEAGSVGSGAGLDLSPGDVYSVEDLLYALLLSSSNEAASALAEHVSGTQEAFVAQMNVYLARIGARDSHFVNPHGLDASGHHSSARDLALIGRALLEEPRLARVVGTARATISTPRGATALTNRNPLLEGYRGAVGIKTGQTLGAGNVLVAAAERGGRLLVAVAMGSADAAADARALLDHGFALPAPEPEPAEPEVEPVVLAARVMVGALVFDPSGATSVVTETPVEAAVAGDYEVLFTPAEEITLPISPGDRIGTVDVSDATGVVASVPAVAEEPIEINDTPWLVRAISGLLGVVARIASGLTA